MGSCRVCDFWCLRYIISLLVQIPLPTIATAVYTLDSQICRPETIFALYNQVRWAFSIHYLTRYVPFFSREELWKNWQRLRPIYRRQVVFLSTIATNFCCSCQRSSILISFALHLNVQYLVRKYILLCNLQRVECWKFKQSFPESMIDVHESLTNMNDACKVCIA